jgi:KaiC/GvpD/RAD55 family RecA-like ATPase
VSETAANGYAVLVDVELERMLVASVIADPRHLAQLREFSAVDLGDMQARAAFAALRNVEHRGEPLTPASVRAELAAEMLRKEPERKLIEHPQVGDLAWFDRLTATPLPAGEPLISSWAYQILGLAASRLAAVEAADEAARAEHEIDDFALRDAEPPAPEPPKPAARPPWFRGRELVDEIMRYATEPWVDLRVGGENMGRVRNGGIVVIMGGSGSGKSSMASALLLEHARNVGPAIALSIELPAEEMAGRMVGMQCDASWEEALRGQVRIEFMEAALDLPRLYIIDRAKATIANLDRCIDAARAEYPDEPIMVAIDYAQIMESPEKEIRMQVAGAFKAIDEIGRRQRVVTLAVSQMGRAGAEAATNGEKIGAASAALGAESAAIERFATMTLSIGAKSEPFPDGSQNVEVSLGKGRMSGGDRVFPMNYWGRTGRWRVAGSAKQAAEVREGRDTERSEKLQKSLELALLGAGMKAAAPIAREDLCEQVQGRGTYKRSAIACLIARGDLVEVAIKKSRSRTWLVWTPERAAEAGMKLVRDMEDL